MKGVSKGRRNLLASLAVLPIAGCLSASSNDTDGKIDDTDNKTGDEQSGSLNQTDDPDNNNTDSEGSTPIENYPEDYIRKNKKGASGSSFHAYRIDSVPNNLDCVPPEDDRLRDTALLEHIRTEMDSSAWVQHDADEHPEQGLGYVDKSADHYDAIVDTLESLPWTYRVDDLAPLPCIEFEEYAIAVLIGFESLD